MCIKNVLLCRARKKFTLFFPRDLVMSLEGSSFWYFTSEQNTCRINLQRSMTLALWGLRYLTIAVFFDLFFIAF